MSYQQLLTIYEESSISRSFDLTQSEIAALIRYSAGNPAIMKGIAKFLNSSNQKPKTLSAGYLINKNEIAARLEYIAKSFNHEELKVIKQLLDGVKPNKTDESYLLLKRVGFINESNKIFSPLVEKYVHDRFFNQPAKIRIKNKEIVISDKPCNHLFTSLESKLLSSLVMHKMKILSRDELFDLIWRDDIDKYSDWNLDQLVRRLRKKLSRFNLDSNILTVKGRGFMWYQDE